MAVFSLAKYDEFERAYSRWYIVHFVLGSKRGLEFPSSSRRL